MWPMGYKGFTQYYMWTVADLILPDKMWFVIFVRKIKPDILGKPKKVIRRSPPRHVSKNEQERIINTAAKLIVATVSEQQEMQLTQKHLYNMEEITVLPNIVRCFL